jgi:hypothetical protein
VYYNIKQKPAQMAGFFCCIFTTNQERWTGPATRDTTPQARPEQLLTDGSSGTVIHTQVS